MRAHVALRQTEVNAQTLGTGFQVANLKIRRLKAALHRRTVDEFGVTIGHLQHAFILLGRIHQHVGEGIPDAGDQTVKGRIVRKASPQHSVRRWNIPLSRSPQRLDRFPVAPRDEFAQGNQVPPPFVFRRCQDVQDQALDHRPGGFIPERIVAFVDDHDGVGDPPGLINRIFVFRIERVERVEPAPEGVVDLGGLERVENLDGLAESLAVGRPIAPARCRDRGVFALRVHDANRPRPKN